MTQQVLSNLVSLKEHFLPEILLMLGSVGVMLLALLKDDKKVHMARGLALVVLVFALVLTVCLPSESKTLFEGMIAADAFGQYFKIIIFATAILAVLFSDWSTDLGKTPRVEFYGFLLALTLGLDVMTVASDLLMIYLAIEMASIISYILAGYISFDTRSEEAGLKYVFYGGMASGVMIFGLSLLYGLTGTLNLSEMREFFLNHSTDRLVLFITFIFVLAGLGYKMAIAPFHMWSPDVYEGAPIAVTAFLSVASKAAGFALTVRFFVTGFLVTDAEGSWSALKALDWQTLMAVLAAITMTLGNLVALRQDNIKRFLAYSSVAHAGYMLMGLVVQNQTGVTSILFYFAIYFLMNLGAFLVAILVLEQFGTESIQDYKGLARRGPFGFFLAFSLSVFLLSLAGIPPFSGFIAKWYVFGSVIESGTNLLWLAVVGVLNSVVSLYYYVRIMKYMMIDEPSSDQIAVNKNPMAAGLMFGLAALNIVFGLFFGAIANWASTSATLL